MADNPIRAALEAAAEEILKNLKDRRGIRQEIDQCDADVQAEIGRTVAAIANATFLRALHARGITAIAGGNLPWLAEAVLAAAKEERE
jgi:hypothetical protein